MPNTNFVWREDLGEQQVFAVSKISKLTQVMPCDDLSDDDAYKRAKRNQHFNEFQNFCGHGCGWLPIALARNKLFVQLICLYFGGNLT